MLLIWLWISLTCFTVNGHQTCNHKAFQSIRRKVINHNTHLHHHSFTCWIRVLHKSNRCRCIKKIKVTPTSLRKSLAMTLNCCYLTTKIVGWAPEQALHSWINVLSYGIHTTDDSRICHCLLLHGCGKQIFTQPFLRSRKLLQLHTHLD